jgi:hypothetical protein
MSFLEPHPSVLLFTGGKGMKQIRSFVGVDVHKATISISVAEDGRSGPVRFIGVIPNTPEAVGKMAKQLARHGELDFCYEASGCGYGIHRQLTGFGHKCTVAAPSMIPRKPGERIKTDRRDSEKLAILHRSGDLTPVWVPDTTHEALRDLVRARVDASMHLMRARQQLLAFLLRHGRSYPTGKHWTQRHRCWLAGQTFQEQAHGIVFQDYLETVWTAQERRDTFARRRSACMYTPLSIQRQRHSATANGGTTHEEQRRIPDHRPHPHCQPSSTRHMQSIARRKVHARDSLLQQKSDLLAQLCCCISWKSTAEL